MQVVLGRHILLEVQGLDLGLELADFLVNGRELAVEGSQRGLGRLDRGLETVERGIERRGQTVEVVEGPRPTRQAGPCRPRCRCVGLLPRSAGLVVTVVEITGLSSLPDGVHRSDRCRVRLAELSLFAIEPLDLVLEPGDRLGRPVALRR